MPPEPEGRTLRYTNIAPKSPGVVGLYVVLILILAYVGSTPNRNAFTPFFLPTVLVLLVVFLARYAATRYWITARNLIAWRLIGIRRVPLDEVRKIQLANLRDLGPVGILGTWGYRGRVWSPLVGPMDAVNTVSPGVLVTGGGVPLFISPRDPVVFARELSRRVRSVNGGASVDESPF